MERAAPVRWTHVWTLAYLQLLDGLTTAAGMKAGLVEANPLVSSLMRLGPGAGVAAAKLLAMAVLGTCVWRRKHRAVKWAIFLYAGVCVWNLLLILAA